MAVELIIRQTPKFLEHLSCGCSKPAEVGWHLPIQKDRVKLKKLSKSDVPPPEEPVKKKGEEPDPYGWSCMDHVPSGLVPMIPGARTLPILGGELA